MNEPPPWTRQARTNSTKSDGGSGRVELGERDAGDQVVGLMMISRSGWLYGAGVAGGWCWWQKQSR